MNDNGDIVEVYERKYEGNFCYYGIRDVDTQEPLMFPNNDWLLFCIFLTVSYMLRQENYKN